MLRLRSDGRGSAYSPIRGAVESFLRIVYIGGWPAALWSRVPGACDVRRVVHALQLLPPEVPTLRVGFLSDLHFGPTTPDALVDAAVRELSAARLDLLLLGGDYVFLDSTPKKATALAALVRAIPATRKLAVLGNHDLWTRHALLERALENAGVEVLENASATLDAPHEGVTVIGLDEPWTGCIDARRAFAGAAEASTIVVLCHSPDGLQDALEARARLPRSPRALYVCGHTHGGHIASPWGPIYVPGRVGKRYPAGLYAVKGSEGVQVHVSRGVGGIELPIRTWAPPEVCIFELTAGGTGA
jgi:predicted MPP superfamily phosphohydrolase